MLFKFLVLIFYIPRYIKDRLTNENEIRKVGLYQGRIEWPELKNKKTYPGPLIFLSC
jgi:hypothetical protein